MKRELCGKMIKCGCMTESRPCVREKEHSGTAHTPDLTGMQFGKGVVISRAKDYVYPNGERCAKWNFKNRYGQVFSARADALIDGRNAGNRARPGTGVGIKDKHGKIKPEYGTVKHHYALVFYPGVSQHENYKNMVFFDDWAPCKGGSIVTGGQWIIENLGPKPGPNWQLHVLKTKKHPHGFFGPGGIMWRHKMDTHDQQALDIIAEWSNKKWLEYIKAESLKRGLKKIAVA